MRIYTTRASTVALTLAGLLVVQSCSPLKPKLTQDIPVTSNPVGATISVDGKTVGQSPLIMTLKKNRNHTVRIEKEGFNPTELVIKQKLKPLAPLYLLAVPVSAGAGLLFGELITILVRAAREQHISNKTSTEAYVGLAIGGALGLTFAVVGMTSPQSHSLSPRSLEVTLTKLTGQGSPQVQVIYLDAGQLKDIQWIRIKLAGVSDGTPAFPHIKRHFPLGNNKQD
jgi:hypothetical protein